MTQHEAVLKTLERLGGLATLGQLYQEVFKLRECVWRTRTPFASVRRIVQLHPDIYKIKPGLYGLKSRRAEHEARGMVASETGEKPGKRERTFDHSYYQGLLLLLGKLRGFDCWAPNQDKNKRFLDTPLGQLRTMDHLPAFSYDRLVKRSATVDVIWFNRRGMPASFFEVEQLGDMQNSLLKFADLQDFHAKMFIVADEKRASEFDNKMRYAAFSSLRERVSFLPHARVVKLYESELEAKPSTLPFIARG